MRIKKMIIRVKMPFFSNSLNSFFKEIYGDQFGELVCGYWGLKSEEKKAFMSPNS